VQGIEPATPNHLPTTREYSLRKDWYSVRNYSGCSPVRALNLPSSAAVWRACQLGNTASAHDGNDVSRQDQFGSGHGKFPPHEEIPSESALDNSHSFFQREIGTGEVVVADNGSRTALCDIANFARSGAVVHVTDRGIWRSSCARGLPNRGAPFIGDGRCGTTL